MTSSNGNNFRVTGLCAGNSPVPVNSPHKGQWRGALMFSVICAWINDRVTNREAGDLRRRHGHYDVNVMQCVSCEKGLMWYHPESPGALLTRWLRAHFTDSLYCHYDGSCVCSPRNSCRQDLKFCPAKPSWYLQLIVPNYWSELNYRHTIFTSNFRLRWKTLVPWVSLPCCATLWVLLPIDCSKGRYRHSIVIPGIWIKHFPLLIIWT